MFLCHAKDYCEGIYRSGAQTTLSSHPELQLREWHCRKEKFNLEVSNLNEHMDELHRSTPETYRYSERGENTFWITLPTPTASTERKRNAES